MAYQARLHKHYHEVVKQKLMKELELENDMEVPRVAQVRGYLQAT
jgi:ribosomal protein L5